VSARFEAPDAQEFRTIELAMASERTTVESVLAALRPGDVFWDIGSNRGVFAVLAARRVGPAGQVFAFEPESGSYAKLLANLALNGLDNVRPLKIALSNRRGRSSLAPGPREGLAQSSRLVDIASPDAETVDVADGDGLGLPAPHVVKVDVEGHEYFTLMGLKHTLSQPQCRTLFCEIHTDRQPAGVVGDAVCALIRDLGFTDLQVQWRGQEMQTLARRPSIDDPS
jgi:FkbM family methyltransferase